MGMNSLARTIVIVILILMLIGSLPTWGYASSWGPYPAGGLGFILHHPDHFDLAGKTVASDEPRSPAITRRVFTPG